MNADEQISLWPPYHAFYIQSMLFNTASALQSHEMASKHIKAISDGKIEPQYRKDELLNCLQNIINQSGAISRYFFPSCDGPKAEAPEQKKMYKNRSQYLRKVFEVDNDSPLKNRDLRNSIEHFDERLDIYLNNGVVGNIFPSLILFEPEETEVPHHIFRAYYLKKGIFQVLGERYKILPIVKELRRIHNLLVRFDGDGEVFETVQNIIG